jgi:hypothetical protein
VVPPTDSMSRVPGVPGVPPPATVPGRPGGPKARGGWGRVGLYLGRSLFPLVAVVILLGTFWWGPWVTLALTAAWWTTVTRIG